MMFLGITCMSDSSIVLGKAGYISWSSLSQSIRLQRPLFQITDESEQCIEPRNNLREGVLVISSGADDYFLLFNKCK